MLKKISFYKDQLQYKYKSDLSKILFCFIMSFLIFLFFKGLINDPQGIQLNVFFLKLDNFFADYFNVLIYISDKNPYFNTLNGLSQKVYLPLSYLILYPFSCLDSYSILSLEEVYSSKISIISVFLYSLISLSVLFFSLSLLSKKLKFKIWILLVLMFSGITLFSIERGNIAILTSGLIAGFLAMYESPFKLLKIIALFLLCIASVLKVYPVLLGFLLLKNKDYKSIIFCVVFSVFLVFAPFMFFENGFDNIKQLLYNVSINNNDYGAKNIFPRFSFQNFVYMSSKYIGFSNQLIDLLILTAKMLTYLLSFLSILLFFYVKDKWKEVALITFVIIQLPTNSALYCGLYFYPVIIMFLNKNDFSKMDFIYIILFCCFLNPYQFLLVSNISINSSVSNLSLFLMWLITIYISTIDYFQIEKQKIILSS